MKYILRTIVLVSVTLLMSQVCLSALYCRCGKTTIILTRKSVYCPPACYQKEFIDHQVDTACVDFCIDKRHTLNDCMRSCTS